MRIEPGTRLGDYEVVSLLGAGGMGEVYRARDLKLRRDVAVKVLSPMLANDADAVARFRREAEAASALNHPHIVTVHGFGETNGLSYMVVELIEGRTLRELINDRDVSREELLRYCGQVIEGLAKAHAAGIVHRDLKPDNIMVTNDGYAKILDFGLAKLQTPQPASPNDPTTPIEPKSRVVIGTAGYISPEQVRGRIADARSDIFAIGCILYEAVTRRQAFEGESSFDVLSNIVHAEPPPINDAQLERIVRRCLAKNPEERYQSVKDVALDLRGGAAGAPPAVGRFGGRFGGRGARLSTGIAVLMLMAIAIFIVLRRPSRGSDIDSLVILPFANATGDANLEYLSDGITDALLNDLSRMPSLRVIARTTAFRYKKTDKPLPSVAKELGVDAIVAGQVRRSGNKLLVDAELIDAADGTRIWGRQYEHDVLANEREIAADVTRALRGSPAAPAPPSTENRAASDLYLKGRYFWNKRDPESAAKALGLFQQALEADPTYARGYSGVADAYIAQMQLGTAPWRQGCDRAIAAARRALELDEQIAEAHASLGYLELCCQLDLAAAEQSFRRALELNPNYAVGHHWYGVYLVNVGRPKEGLPQVQEAARLDPFSTQIQANVSFAMVHAGLRDEAVKHIDETIELDPNALYPRHMRGYVALASGDYPKAIEALEYSSSRGFAVSKSFLAYAYARTGNREKALATLEDLGPITPGITHPAALRAGTFFALGERDRALALLDEAYANRDYWLSAMRISPPFEPLRGEAKYREILGEIR